MQSKHFPQKTDDTSLRIATFNIWGWFGNWPERAILLKELWDNSPQGSLPDILLLQEGCFTKTSDQTKEVVEMLGYPYWLHALGTMTEPFGEGVAIASRIPFTHARTFPLPQSKPGRTIAMAWIKVANDKELCCVSAHAAYTPDVIRDAQIKAICDLQAKCLIIGGDLNATPEVVKEHLTNNNLIDSLEDKPANTWPVDADFFAKGWAKQMGRLPDFSLEPRRLDYLLSRGCQASKSGVVAGGSQKRGYPSDHALIWADYSF